MPITLHDNVGASAMTVCKCLTDGASLPSSYLERAFGQRAQVALAHLARAVRLLKHLVGDTLNLIVLALAPSEVFQAPGTYLDWRLLLPFAQGTCTHSLPSAVETLLVAQSRFLSAPHRFSCTFFHCGVVRLAPSHQINPSLCKFLGTCLPPFLSDTFLPWGVCPLAFLPPVAVSGPALPPLPRSR